jgi:hypothetical protein
VRFGKSSATQRKDKKKKKKDTRPFLNFSHRLVPLPCRNHYRSSLARLVTTVVANRFLHHHLVGVRFDQNTNHHQHKKKKKTPPFDSPHTFARATGVVSFCALGRAIFFSSRKKKTQPPSPVDK